MNKTIYVRDEDGPVWDRARELAGEGISQLIVDKVKSFVAQEEGKQRGFERIVLRYVEDGIPHGKAFVGRWLIPPEDCWNDPYTRAFEQLENRAVAVTAKQNVVIFAFDHVEEDGEFGRGCLYIYDSLDIALAHHSSALIELAMRRLGVEIQELDI